MFLSNEINFVVSVEVMTRLMIFNEGKWVLHLPQRGTDIKVATWKLTQTAEPVICNNVTVRF